MALAEQLQTDRISDDADEQLAMVIGQLISENNVFWASELERVLWRTLAVWAQSSELAASVASEAVTFANSCLDKRDVLLTKSIRSGARPDAQVPFGN